MSHSAASRGPAPDRRYRFADHGNSDTGGGQGKHFILNNQAELWSPAFKEGTTTIRILPQKNPQNPNEWDPYRISTGVKEFGDWIRCYPAIRNCGDPGISYIMYDPADPTVDVQCLPAWVLYTAVHRAIKNKQEGQGWAALTTGGKDKGPALARPSSVYFVQAFILQHGQNTYQPPKGYSADDRTIVMDLSKSAGDALVAECEKLRENPQPTHPNDWEQLYLNGDPVGLDAGRFVTFYNLATGDPRQRNMAPVSSWNAPAMSGPQGGRDLKGFGCFVEPNFYNLAANLRGAEQTVAQKVKPWDQILHFPSIEEQAHLLADKFPPDVILYAFQDHPDWIPDIIQRRAVASRTVGAPAGGWQQGWGAPGMAGPQTAYGPSGFGAPPVGPPPQAGPPMSTGFGAMTGSVGGGFPPQLPPGAAPVAPNGGYGQPTEYPPQAAPTGFAQAPAAPFAPPMQSTGFPPQNAPPMGGFAAPAQQGFGTPPQQGFGAPQQQAGFGAPAGFNPGQPSGPPAGFGPPPQPMALPNGFGQQGPPPGPQAPQGAPAWPSQPAAPPVQQQLPPQQQPAWGAPQQQMPPPVQQQLPPAAPPQGFAAPTGFQQGPPPQHAQPPAGAWPQGAPAQPAIPATMGWGNANSAAPPAGQPPVATTAGIQQPAAGFAAPPQPGSPPTGRAAAALAAAQAASQQG